MAEAGRAVGAERGCRLRLMPMVRLAVDGAEVRLPQGLSSLVVAVTLEPGGVGRRALQGRMWPDQPPEAAAKRLRQMLWRIRAATDGRLLDVSGDQVRLADHVEVDLRVAERVARQVIESDGAASADRTLLGTELLVGWSDADVLGARDRWNRLRLLALERLAEESLRAGAVLAAIELADLATKADEFAETAYRVMASAHLLRGDHAGALRVYGGYRRLLDRELGLEPSPGFRELLGRGGVARSPRKRPGRGAVLAS